MNRPIPPAVRTIEQLESYDVRVRRLRHNHAPNVARFIVHGWPDDLIYACTDCGHLYPWSADPDAGCPHCGLGTDPREALLEISVREFLGILQDDWPSVGWSVENALEMLVHQARSQRPGCSPYRPYHPRLAEITGDRRHAA